MSPPPGAVGLEALAGPSGVPAGTIDSPVPEDMADATVAPRHDPCLAAHARASKLAALNDSSQQPFDRTSSYRPPASEDVHRVALLPRPPPHPTLA